MTTQPATVPPARRPRPDRQRIRQREQSIADMIVSGASIGDVGAQFGAKTRGPAIRLVQRALESQLPQFDADLSRRVDLARLDALLASWWDKAIAGNEFAAHVVLSVLDLRTRLEVNRASPTDNGQSTTHRPQTGR